MLINNDLANKDNSYSHIFELVFIAFSEIQRFLETHLPLLYGFIPDNRKHSVMKIKPQIES